MTAVVSRRVHHAAARGGALTGTGRMVRLLLRRDAVRLTIWLVVLVAMIPLVHASQLEAFPTEASRQAYAQVAHTPAIAAMTGLPYAAGTMGGILVIKIWMTLAIALSFASILLTTRHLRAEEEAGRAELLGAGVLGRHARSTASAIVVGGLDVAVGLGIAIACLGAGLPVAGSWLMGASIAGVGLAFLGVAAVCDRLARTARGANGIAFCVLALAYLVRAIADLRPDGEEIDPLSWASPIGWGQNVRAFGADDPLPLLPLVGLAAAGVLLAAWIDTARDLGAGALPESRGPERASAALATPLGLAVRLRRTTIVGWTLGVLAAAAFFGGVATAMSGLLSPNEEYTRAFIGETGDVLDGLLGYFLMVGSMLVAAFAVQCVGDARGEEASGMLEPQLAGSVSRTAWLGIRVLVALVASAALLALGGAVTQLAFGHGSALVGPSLAYLPVVVLLVGVSAFCVGWMPRAALAVSWAVYGLAAVVAMFGGLLSLPDDLVDATPFAAVPRYGADADILPLVVMTAIGAVLGVLGLARYRARDLVG